MFSNLNNLYQQFKQLFKKQPQLKWWAYSVNKISSAAELGLEQEQNPSLRKHFVVYSSVQHSEYERKEKWDLSWGGQEQEA